jgi:hypothetical protein
MIIDDKHKVAFIHIPKCGGTSIAVQLSGLDSYDGYFRRNGEHPQLGRAPYMHIPLFYLKQEFPDVFEKVAAYRSFALIREPYERFASATFQRLAEYDGVSLTPRSQITVEAAISEGRKVAEWLSGRDSFWSMDYIHFTRQADYVFLGGEQVVHNVFPMEDMSAMTSCIESHCDIAIDASRRENPNFATSGGLVRSLHVLKPIYSRLTTWPMRRRLIALLRKLNWYSPAPLYKMFRDDPVIGAFVDDYYSRDFALYDAARDRMNAVGGS